MFKPGDKVRMNDKFCVSAENQKKIFTVKSDPFLYGGTWLVAIDGWDDGYAVDGLDLVEAAK